MNAVIVVSGGSGSRMRKKPPKQYIEINGKPILAWTIDKFLHFDPDIQVILVLGEDHEEYWAPIKEQYFSGINILTTRGGVSRFDSVKNGLSLIEGEMVVGIHDAVRPMVTVETISRCYESAKKHQSGIPVVDIEDSIRILDKKSNRPIERSILVRIQTPQVFQSEKITRAYQQPFDPKFTDDATVFESIYKEVNLVSGNPENIKITLQTDLEIASCLLCSN